MKISPMPGAAASPAVAPQATMARALKMTTNATPGREEPSNSDPQLEVSEADEVTQPLSPQFAALAKQRRALQVKEREIADKLKEIETRGATQAGGIDAARLKSDPLGVLLEAGVTYEQLTEAVLANQDGSQIRALEAKIQALEEGVNKKLTDRDAQAEQQVLAEMKREASTLIAQGDEFEMVRETQSLPHVMTLIEKTYRETGEVLEVREALKLVEDELFKDSLRLAKLNKVQAQFAPPPPEPQPTQSHRQSMRTLTNRDTASVPMSARARALAAFNGTLRR